MLKKNLVIGIYSPPEYYPPTLNAVEYLAGEFEDTTIVFRNYSGAYDWSYPKGVHLIPVGKNISVRKAEASSTFKKVFYFLQYTLKLLVTIWRARPDTILIYDYLPILSLRMIWRLIKRPRILWYHNHDVGDESFLRRWSVSWMAWKSEKWIFPKLSVFTLPSLDRKPFFPMKRLSGEFFFLPNFPSYKIFSRFSHLSKSDSSGIKILYQGSIGPLHGIEELLSILDRDFEGKKAQLILKGFISKDYQDELTALARMYGVNDQFAILPPTGYDKVIENSMSCHIGIGIHRKEDIMNKTLGTSSNKIYEYAASGLPVLLFNNEHFRTHLGHFDWAFFTDCSADSLISNIRGIVQNYEGLSARAKSDFEKELNFEKYFEPISCFLNS